MSLGVNMCKSLLSKVWNMYTNQCRMNVCDVSMVSWKNKPTLWGDSEAEEKKPVVLQNRPADPSCCSLQPKRKREKINSEEIWSVSKLQSCWFRLSRSSSAPFSFPPLWFISVLCVSLLQVLSWTTLSPPVLPLTDPVWTLCRESYLPPSSSSYRHAEVELTSVYLRLGPTHSRYILNVCVVYSTRLTTRRIRIICSGRKVTLTK